MINKTFQGNLQVREFATREEMGTDAAEAVATTIKDLLKEKEYVNMIFASAPSQNEFLIGLENAKDVDWSRVVAFHMDEYIGLKSDHPQTFANFLRKKLFNKLPFHKVHYIDGNADSPDGECKRYSQLLMDNPVDIVCMGIGENNHIAFNDPHVADFDDSRLVKIVDLDSESRQQQVNDGCFDSIEDVPTHALTLTIPALTNANYIYCIVPGKNKAKAVRHTLKEEISPRYPSTILRTHSDAILFLDKDSASAL
ncbi:glucosamine-6-phosphate deaminase [Albibacterium indicum]|uniref:glucosamine-6-phosphate deaminase n=1 Tax=Albibacterium indicum TaxID=2292082 RepID=UPI000E53DCFC|nr:glucosamine-6-phosphate deaminase [Pedobacter indicus]